jgi:hypothetical protein
MVHFKTGQNAKARSYQDNKAAELHCGDANSSDKRRVLFYFTLSKQADWPLPNGLHGSNSIIAADKGKWKVKHMAAQGLVGAE